MREKVGRRIVHVRPSIILTLPALQVLVWLLEGSATVPDPSASEALQETSLFHDYFESLPEDMAALYTESAETETGLWEQLRREMVEEICRHHCFVAAVRCVHATVVAVPNESHGLSPFLPSLYAACTASGFATIEGDTADKSGSTGLDQLLKYAVSLDRPTVERLLEVVANELDRCIVTILADDRMQDHEHVASVTCALKKSGKHVRQAASALSQSSAQSSSASTAAAAAAVESAAAQASTVVASGPAKRRRALLSPARATLAVRADAPFTKARREAVASLKGVLHQYLRPPSTTSSTLVGRLLCFDSAVAKTLDGRPRAHIHRALSSPQVYFRLGEAAGSSGARIPDPDTATLYQLVLECGKWVNLHDLLKSFNAQVGTNESAKLTRKVQAQFLRSLSELQYLGLIKATKRKADHVQRLTTANTL